MMRRLTRFVSVFLAMLVSFSVWSAQEINREQAKEMNLTKLGTVSTEMQSAPGDAKARLSQKADKMGGKYFLIIAADEKARMHATAIVYGDKTP
ncbi:DUF1471 domain-containing protein [Enterobacteriaceae bacterium LUAb1]